IEAAGVDAIAQLSLNERVEPPEIGVEVRIDVGIGNHGRMNRGHGLLERHLRLAVAFALPGTTMASQQILVLGELLSKFAEHAFERHTGSSSRFLSSQLA